MLELEKLHILVNNQIPETQVEKLLSDIEETEKLLTFHKANLAMLQVEVQHFEQRYYTAVGALYTQLDEVKAQIAEHFASASPQSDELALEATEARKLATNTALEASSRLTYKASNRVGPQQEPNPSASKPIDSARKMKKKIAKWTHPDLVQSDADKQLCHKIMLAVNNACEAGDMDCLGQILLDLTLAPEDAHTPEAIRIAHLTTYLNQVQKQLAEIKLSLFEVELSDIFQIKTQMENAEKQGIDILGEMAHNIQAEITQVTEQLSHLMGKQKRRGKKNDR